MCTEKQAGPDPLFASSRDCPPGRSSWSYYRRAHQGTSGGLIILINLLSKGYYGLGTLPPPLCNLRSSSSHFGILGSQAPADLPCMVRPSALWLFPCCVQASLGKLMSCGILTTRLRLLFWFVAPLHRWMFILFLNMLNQVVLYRLGARTWWEWVDPWAA